MATETLKCTVCSNNWSREVVRGRKPRACPDCKAPKKVKPKPAPESTKRAQQQYKRRVQAKGGLFRPLGDVVSERTTTDGKVLKTYASYETEDGVVVKGSMLTDNTTQDNFLFDKLVIREDGTGYAELRGVGGIYDKKYRAISVTRLSL